MKVATILALPALALAAAAPKVQERQIPGFPGLPDDPLDVDCLTELLGSNPCLSPIPPAPVLSDLIVCPLFIIFGAIDCIIGGVAK